MQVTKTRNLNTRYKLTQIRRYAKTETSADDHTKPMDKMEHTAETKMQQEMGNERSGNVAVSMKHDDAYGAKK